MSDEKKAYTYKVVERCFKYGIRYDPAKMDPPIAVFDKPENSKALEPADEFTKVATDALKLEHKKFYEKRAPITGDEAAELRLQLAAKDARLVGLEAKLDALLALSAGDEPAPKKLKKSDPAS